MGYRFQRRIRIAPGVRLNLSKSGIGGSLGAQACDMELMQSGKSISLLACPEPAFLAMLFSTDD